MDFGAKPPDRRDFQGGAGAGAGAGGGGVDSPYIADIAGGGGLHAIDTDVRRGDHGGGPPGGLRAWQAPDVAGSMNFTDDAPTAAVLERWYHARGGDAVGPR